MLLVRLHVVPPQSFVQASFQSALPPEPPFHLIQRWVTVRACPSLHGGVTITPRPGGGCPVVAAASLGPPARRGGRTSTGLAMPSRCGASLCSTCLAMPSRFCSHTVACCLDRTRFLLHRPGLVVAREARVWRGEGGNNKAWLWLHRGQGDQLCTAHPSAWVGAKVGGQGGVCVWGGEHHLRARSLPLTPSLGTLAFLTSITQHLKVHLSPGVLCRRWGRRQCWRRGRAERGRRCRR